MSSARPVVSGRVDSLGRRVMVSAGAVGGRAVAPAPPSVVDDELRDAIWHFAQANDLGHERAARLARHVVEDARRFGRSVFRGVCGQALSGVAYSTMRPGDRVSLGVCSTSTDRDVADEFSWDDSDDDNYAVTLEIRGGSGVDVSWASVFPDQCEHLLAAGDFEVVSIDADVDDDHTLRIVLSAVGCGGAPASVHDG